MSGRRKRKRESSEERLQRKLACEQKLGKVRSRRRPPLPAPTLQSVHTDDDAAGISPSPHQNEENNFITKPNDENTDSSLTGWGCSGGKERAAGLWNEHDKLQHINYLELNAAFLALKTFTSNILKL
ncbi:uncharacterized protein LOC123667041 isoform X2 [Melitaea cinxia]|uniref:uncharacterized protein LOC123667041 isoform X2 n=1 Tax=Melitaea cinxia TaxID=113334 RepID=UPI001E2720A1|nr:uncharacterized protein LOC123667041 isoform X2 [Melitaea cinxia]